MTVSYWLAVLAYVLPTFPLGYFWHLKTFKARYDQLGMYREDVIIPMGLTSMLIQGLFFAWAYPKLFDATRWLSGALGFFAVFGLLAFSFAVLPVAAKFRMTSVPGFVRLETVFTAIQFAVSGLLVALVYAA